DDLGHLPAFRPAHHITGDDRTFQRVLAAGTAQARHVQQDVLQICLTGIVRDDEAIALARVEPFDPTADAHGLDLRIDLLQFVTSHMPLGPLLSDPDNRTEPTITLFW